MFVWGYVFEGTFVDGVRQFQPAPFSSAIAIGIAVVSVIYSLVSPLRTLVFQTSRGLPVSVALGARSDEASAQLEAEMLEALHLAKSRAPSAQSA